VTNGEAKIIGVTGNGGSRATDWIRAVWPLLVALVMVAGAYYTLQGDVAKVKSDITELREERKTDFRMTEREYNALIRRLDSIEEKVDKTNDRLDRRGKPSQ
jgi:uncharacterized protein HemX